MKKKLRALISAVLMAVVIFGITPAITPAAATVYHAYMGVQTSPQYIFRNAWDDPNLGLGNDVFKGLSANGKMLDGVFTDTTFQKDGTYTVVLDNPDFGGDSAFTQLFVSTDIPMSSKLKVTNVTLKIDGSTVHTFAKGDIDMEGKFYTSIMCVNIWRKELDNLFTYKMPQSKCEITFTISGLKDVEAEKKTLKDFNFLPYKDCVYVAGYTGKATSVKLPTDALRKTVTAISAKAFENSSVKEVIIPDTVQKIARHAFYNSKLTTMTIPKNVATIEDGVFASCSGIKKFTVSKTNTAFVVKDGVLFTKDMKTLVQYPAGKTDKSYTVPSSVTKIQGGAFDGCTKLTKLTASGNVKNIGRDVFKGCNSLTIYAPENSSVYSYAVKQNIKVKKG